MQRLLVNDVEQTCADVPQSWGDLLDRLEQDADGRGEVVTAVRFEGVDEPTFRQAPVTGRRLSDVTVIEVETATPHGLLAGVLADGMTGADSLTEAAGATAAAFRSSDVRAANTRLAEFGEGVGSLLALMVTAADAMHLGLEALDWDGTPAAARLAALGEQIESMIAAQQEQDWLTVADILEYDLQPVLASARSVFERLHAAIPA